MSKKQLNTLEYLLQDLSLVLDRVYYDHKTERVNFRGHFHWNAELQRPVFLGGQTRMAIHKTGGIVNRTSDEAFAQH